MTGLTSQLALRSAELSFDQLPDDVVTTARSLPHALWRSAVSVDFG